MKLELSKLFDNPGEIVELDTALDLGEVIRWGSNLFAKPVQVTGRVETCASVVQLRYAVEFTLAAPCDRCLTIVDRQKRENFSHILVRSLNCEDNGEFIVVSDGKLDLAELVTADILLSLPTSILCDKDCLGLCPVCGKNLNEGACNCDRTVRDPRLDVLRGLLAE